MEEIENDYLKRAMTEAEDKYTFEQSSEINEKTGLIGYLRADFGVDGKGFYSSWEDWNKERKTPDFQLEFDEVINCLREEGDILSSRAAMSKYCRQTPQSQMTTEPHFYGVRVDTNFYAYLLRMNPEKGDYNLYCYCYERKWLDHHMKQAERGIRFIDPNYKEIFRIPDGDKIRILRPDGTHIDKTCRYIDDCHVEIGGGWDSLFHICQFAEQMEQCGNTVLPLRSSLPAQCYVYLPTTQEIGIVKKGESGYYRSDLSPVYGQDGKAFVEELNRQGGVTKAQAAAMSAGSMFGWACPAADPKNYGVDGNLIKPRQKERDETR